MGAPETASGAQIMSRRPYIRPVSKTTWYLKQSRYRGYMLRELTCLLVAFYCVLTMIALAAAMDADPQRWSEFILGQQKPAWLVFHVFALVFFTVYQTIAWFRLAPKAMPLQLGDKVVAPGTIVAAHYVAWGVVSLVTLWIAGVF